MERIEQTRDKAIAVGVQLNQAPGFRASMEELRSLADACELEVVGEVTQKAEKIITGTYMGSGKIEELKEAMTANQAGIAIFNDELSPSQIRNLEAQLDCRVIDRTLLILDIFASRAQTREAKLQVEVARLQYMLPRLIGLRESLGRQGGGAGLKNRGAGETKLELDRRRIEDRISALQDDLEKLVARRQVQRNQRRKNEIPVVCLVGYTNAGKSSLMNAVIRKVDPGSDKEVLAKDMLFATLDPTARAIKLPHGARIMLSDTVGFISDLPTQLVAAFRATLEDAIEADVLLHVRDVSHEDTQAQAADVQAILRDLGINPDDGQRVVEVWNKADLLDGEERARQLEVAAHRPEESRPVLVSALTGEGMDRLTAAVEARIARSRPVYALTLEAGDGRSLAWLHANGEILGREDGAEGALALTVRLPLEREGAFGARFPEARRLS